jgi:hypothetical protein
MVSKCKILVLFLALGILAAPEQLSKSSDQFVFQQGIGVRYFAIAAVNGLSFAYKKVISGKEGLVFSWTLPKSKADIGKLSIYSVSGKLIKSFNLTTPEGSISWNMPKGKMSSGVYLARLSYGSFNRSLKIIY